MRNFYHYRLQQDGNTDKLPHILGLTASPITSGCREELEYSILPLSTFSDLSLTKCRRLENNLNAVCVAPKMHREEMMQFVYMPTFYNIKYSLDFRGPPTKADRLLWLIENLNIEDDPFVRFMREKNDPKSQKKLMEALEKNKTPCLIQLRRCYNRSIILHAELGCWAADTFLALCLKSIMNKYANKSNKIEMKWTDWGRQDVLYISKVLSQLDIPAERQRWTAQPNEISTKVHRLVDFLEKEHVKGSAGIIFAKERTTVIMLTRLISMHPRLSHVRAAAVLGSSAFATRKSDITELHDLATQSTAIDDLRSGKKNLIIATSVLEEGIDVPACDAVICFDLPQNLRSFVQRRGRARKKGSKFAIFVDASDTKIIAELQSMEETMKEFYLEQERVRQEIQVLENAEEQGYDGFRIPSTG